MCMCLSPSRPNLQAFFMCVYYNTQGDQSNLYGHIVTKVHDDIISLYLYDVHTVQLI